MKLIERKCLYLAKLKPDLRQAVIQQMNESPSDKAIAEALEELRNPAEPDNDN